MTVANHRILQRNQALSLIELISVVAIIGLFAALALPFMDGIMDEADDVKSQKNAKEILSVSSALSTAGVAHVLPDSLGGVQATARLLKEGVIVPDGPYVGQKFQLQGLTNEEIEKAASYLQIFYEFDSLVLRYSSAT